MTQLPHNIDLLTSALRNNPDLPVMFTQNEHTISPGYHITEVKTVVVNSLDCGQGTDQWHELVIQLLDGNADSSGTYMQSKKMMSILDQALNARHLDDSTQLYFEFTPGNLPLQKSSVSGVEVVNNTITIALATTSAQCKPYQRALASGKELSGAQGCCGSSQTQKQSCCDISSAGAESSCCV